MTINYARESVIDFTKPFMNLGISILFKVRQTGGRWRVHDERQREGMDGWMDGWKERKEVKDGRK